jgi:hypothetical protein
MKEVEFIPFPFQGSESSSDSSSDESDEEDETMGNIEIDEAALARARVEDD